jgi:hypothetical protein
VRGQAYWLFALVAWPAAAWGAIETVLRVAAGYSDGMGQSLALTACAVATILGCAWRKRALAEAAVSAPR